MLLGSSISLFGLLRTATPKKLFAVKLFAMMHVGMATMRDAALMFITAMALLLALGLLGVPLLAAGFGLNEQGTWQSVTVALVLLATSGYIFVSLTTDLFSSSKYASDELLLTDYKQRYKPVLIAVVLLAVVLGLQYSKNRSY